MDELHAHRRADNALPLHQHLFRHHSTPAARTAAVTRVMGTCSTPRGRKQHCSCLTSSYLSTAVPSLAWRQRTLFHADKARACALPQHHGRLRCEPDLAEQLPRSHAPASSADEAIATTNFDHRRSVARSGRLRLLSPPSSLALFFRALVLLFLVSPVCGASAPPDTATSKQGSSSSISSSISTDQFESVGASKTRTHSRPALIIAKHLGTLTPESMNASMVVMPGAVARVPFDVQPEIQVPLDHQEARDGSIIAVDFENNPSCGSLEGTLSAPIVDGVAKFTDLGISEHGRDYSLRFCFGVCRGTSADGLTDILTKDILDVVTPQFGVRYGRLLLLQSAERAIAGYPFEVQPSIRVERVVDGEFVLAHDYNYAVIAHYYSRGWNGRSTMWADTGIVHFTDLGIDRADPFTVILFTACAGAPFEDCFEGAPDAMTAITRVFNVEHNIPAATIIVQQPDVLTTGGTPLGSECKQFLGDVCKVFEVVRPVELQLFDAYQNLVGTEKYGKIVACATVYQHGRRSGLANLIGASTESFVHGVARFTNLAFTMVGTGYTLNISVHNDTCDSRSSAFVVTREIEIAATMITQLAIVTAPGAVNEIAGQKLKSTPVVSFQDFDGNPVLGGTNLTIFVELHTYVNVSLPPPGDWSDLARSLDYVAADAAPLMYSSACLGGVSKSCIRKQLSLDSVGVFADLSFRRMGWYTMRFYGWVHVVVTHPFYVANAEARTVVTLRSPLDSSCTGESSKILSKCPRVCCVLLASVCPFSIICFGRAVARSCRASD